MTLINICLPFFIHRFNVTLDDCPGGIAELCRILADIEVTIKDIMHERAWLRDIYSVEVLENASLLRATIFFYTVNLVAG